MANEIDSGGSAAETIAAEIVDRIMLPAAYGPTPILRTLRVKDMRGENSLVSEHVKWPELTSSVSALTDGSDMSNTDVDTTSVQATVSEHGLMHTITDLFVSASITNVADFGMQAGMAVGQDIEVNLAAEFADFTTTVGSTGVDLTNANFLSAIHQMELNGLEDRGPVVSVLHPIQISDLRTDIASITGTVFGDGIATDPFRIGQSWSLYGVPIFSSRRCAAVNAGADRQGAIYPAGQFSPLVYSVKWDPRTEFQRDASMRGWEVVVTAAYGDENVDPAGGFNIITDHE